MDSQESRALQDGIDDTAAETSLADQILQIIEDAPHHTIRPAKVAAALGISVNDACSELCGLMAAVGGGPNGASFRFIQPGATMEFQFPPDFARRARQKQRLNDFKTSLQAAAKVTIRAIKVVTAFGLIISLLILCIIAMAALLAMLVAASRAGQDHGGHRSVLTRQIRSLFYTIRELLWLYAVFGPSPEGQDPVMREMAYDLSLVLSCCCGNPASFFYWWRARQLANRQHQAMRRWRDSTAMMSEIPGVYLVREGGWNEREGTTSGERHKGLLSIAIEFLFGPDPPQPEDPSAVWRLRVAVILSGPRKHKEGSVSLADLTPYVDYPPRNSQQSAQLIEQTILIVAHFNGVPKEACDSTERLLDAEFLFPELIVESDLGPYQQTVWEDDETFSAFLYRKDGASRQVSDSVPDYWHEERYKFSRLTATQLIHCVTLGFLNFFGVQWLRQWTNESGLITTSFAVGYVLAFIFPILHIYAMVFLAIPAIRMGILLILNRKRNERNRRRQSLAVALEKS
ncbi:hypothetical protein FisN_12Lh192 [Fistulifera solaris]|uniref:Uncharacterized protein n=1 Tax=Fistulifera solaris TaxID=1519565 RepID=A0A1Z5JM99_FISSO|nr:hypothetical protein FisN_12Lh192 [Fistulifera solaris]|eukprot:GAX15114.1 hypothetical protein FisN_12Lh192 [Fistulifera solaris]